MFPFVFNDSEEEDSITINGQGSICFRWFTNFLNYIRKWICSITQSTNCLKSILETFHCPLVFDEFILDNITILV